MFQDMDLYTVGLNKKRQEDNLNLRYIQVDSLEDVQRKKANMYKLLDHLNHDIDYLDHMVKENRDFSRLVLVVLDDT